MMIIGIFQIQKVVWVNSFQFFPPKTLQLVHGSRKRTYVKTDFCERTMHRDMVTKTKTNNKLIIWSIWKEAGRSSKDFGTLWVVFEKKVQPSAAEKPVDREATAWATSSLCNSHTTAEESVDSKCILDKNKNCFPSSSFYIFWRQQNKTTKIITNIVIINIVKCILSTVKCLGFVILVVLFCCRQNI